MPLNPRIPRQVELMGLTYTTVEGPDLRAEDGNFAEVKHGPQRIIIDASMHPDRQCVCAIHEYLHVANLQLGLQLKEAEIESLSQWLYMVLKVNRLHFDQSEK